ncbi:MAG: peptidoglycan-associated lipoprotein Pal [Deltaproteobacteria bacterium]|nr:peptidoglycan-associated lipoprotein Pal [Deltaproteobacteria bacterium]
MGHFRMACYGIVGLVLLAMACAPSTMNKADTGSSPAAGSDPRSATKPPQGEGQRGGTRETTTDRSSLGQLQEGKSSESTGPLKDILFDFDSHNLRADARDTLRANAEWLKRNTAARVEIEGHCDDRGTNEYNLALGAKRAQAAKDYLATLGVASDRLSTISYGEEIPVCKDANETCWSRNRRARFVVLPSRPAS